VVSISALTQTDQFRVTINFEQPVDVIKFEGWSALRKRVSSQIAGNGRSPQRTSDGAPIMVLDL